MKIYTKDGPKSKAVNDAMVAVGKHLGVNVEIIEGDGSNEQPKLLSIKQTSERLSVSPDTIRRMIHAGKITPIKLNSARNGTVRIDPRALESLINQCSGSEGDIK